jgi:hypothetical protein
VKLRKILLVLAVSGVAAFGVAACGDDDDDESASATTTEESAYGSDDESASAGDASVSFVEPTDGAKVGDPVTAEVELEGFEINADEVGMDNVEGEGHLHFSMDGGEFDTPKYSGANGELAVSLGVDGQYSPATEETITYEGLPKGEHTLEVDLVNNDHTETGTSATVTFEVE